MKFSTYYKQLAEEISDGKYSKKYYAFERKNMYKLEAAERKVFGCDFIYELSEDEKVIAALFMHLLAKDQGM